jgi:hypothetical protein
MGAAALRLGSPKLWFGVVLMAAPVPVACATGETGELPDGGEAPDAGSDAHARHDGSGGSEGGTTCSKSSQCCTSAQCPPTAHVQTTMCMGGSCAISTCAPGWYDFDASYASGCNCQAEGGASSCGTANVVPPLALGAKTTLSGNLPTEDGETWYQITFSGSNSNITYHPKISFTTNPNNEFVFNIVASCSGAPLSCADLEAGTSLTTWEEYYDVSPDASELKAIPAVGAAGVVLIEVHRANPGASCDSYELTVSD